MRFGRFVGKPFCEIRLGNSRGIWDALGVTRNITIMALWEYKVITSGPHGFASPALLEAHLNALGKDEWEIVHFQTLPNNALAFHGLARRSTMRDWSPPPELVVSAPPRPVEATPVATKLAPAAKAEAESLAARMEEKGDAVPPLREESLRPMRDTERDLDPEAEEDEAEEEEDWDNWEEDDEDLPNFFEAIKPHLRRNQKGPGMSVAVDYLAKRWDQREADLVGALKECGFTIPETEEGDADFFEFEGDLYWVNRNNRGQLFINTREKPRPVFRVTQAKKLSADDPATADIVAERAAEKAEIEKRKTEQAERAERQATERAERQAARAAAAAARESGPAIADQPDSPSSAEETEKVSVEPGAPIPSGPELLEKIRPMMRRNRRGPGYSGSIGYLARALKHSEAEVSAALAALGLNVPASSNDKPVYVEIGDGVYWMNKDNRGGIWINGREKREGGGHKGGAQVATNGSSAEVPSAGSDSEESAGQQSEATTGIAAPNEHPEGSAMPAAEAVPPMIKPDAAIEEGVPDREITARPAEVTPQVNESSSDSPGSSSESQPAEPKSEESMAPFGAEVEKEGTRSGKTSRPRRTGASRSRTRKPKTDTPASSESTPPSESAAVPEDDVAKPDEPAS